MGLPDRMVSAVAEGRQAYVAVETKNGPHVTPELYAWSNDALWIATATTTLKTRQLERDPTSIGVVVRLAGRDVALTGSVDVFDPRRPADMLRQARRLPDAAMAGTRFAVRNANDLLSFVGDTISGKLGRRIPPPRVLFGLRPDRAALIEGETVVETWNWDAPDAGHDVAPHPGGLRAVAALPGPIALPCWWFEDEQRAFIAPSALALADGARTSAIAVVVDEYNAPGPAAKEGLLYRGQGVASGEDGYIDVAVDKVVGWDGVDVSHG